MKNKQNRGGKNTRQPTQADVDVVVGLFSEGIYAEAEKEAKGFIKRFPSHSFGYKALGAIYTEVGLNKEAVNPMKTAVRLDPWDEELRSNLGNAFKSLGQLVDAEKSYRKALSINPAYFDALGGLGTVLKDQARYIESKQVFEKAIGIMPKDARSRVRLGNVLMLLGDMGQADQCFRDALKIDPNCLEALHCLALCLTHLRRHEEAYDYYQKAIAIDPESPALLNNRGNMLKAIGKFSEAEASYREALEKDSLNPVFYNNLAMAQYDQGRAFEAQAACRIALALDPKCKEAIGNLGVILSGNGDLLEAEALYTEALRLMPNDPGLLSNLAGLYTLQGLLPKAVATFKKALSIKPDYCVAHSNLLFSSNYLPDYTGEQSRTDAEVYAKQASKNIKQYTTWKTPDDGPLRVGVVSGDLGNHPVGYFLQSFMHNLDRNRFEWYAYPTHLRSGEVADSLRPVFNKWSSLMGLSDEAAAQLIHDDAPHILIDLSGHTAHNRLGIFAYKPAPVQATWLGYFATTGLPQIDYIIGDPYVTPLADAPHFSEQIWQLPNNYACMSMPSDTPPVSELPALANGFITFGCFNNLSKINEGVIDLWAKILGRYSTSKLKLKTRQLADEKAANGIRILFAARGIDADRLILEPGGDRMDMLRAYADVDICLDPFPYPGGSTSYESLAMGVPVLTKKGDRFLSRVGEGIVSNAGLEQWLAADDEQYLCKAIALATDLDALNSLRKEMRSRLSTSPLFDHKRFAADFEDALHGMWNQKMCNGVSE